MLTRLDLSDNQITAQGTQYLSEGLRKNKYSTNSFPYLHFFWRWRCDECL